MADATTRETRGSGCETDGLLLCVVANCARRTFGDFFAAVARDAMADRGIGDPRPNGRYDTASVVAVYEAVGRRVGPNALERVGRRLPVVVDWPPGVRNVGDALGALDRVYGDLHRGEAGGYEYTPTGPTGGRLASTTPYPAAFERGLACGVGTRFGDGSGFVVSDRTAGGDTTSVHDDDTASVRDVDTSSVRDVDTSSVRDVDTSSVHDDDTTSVGERTAFTCRWWSAPDEEWG